MITSTKLNEEMTIFEMLVSNNEDILEDKENCPFPIDIIPNNMGINLCSVNRIIWEKQSDGQLKNLTIIFDPTIKEN